MLCSLQHCSYVLVNEHTPPSAQVKGRSRWLARQPCSGPSSTPGFDQPDPIAADRPADRRPHLGPLLQGWRPPFRLPPRPSPRLPDTGFPASLASRHEQRHGSNQGSHHRSNHGSRRGHRRRDHGRPRPGGRRRRTGGRCGLPGAHAVFPAPGVGRARCGRDLGRGVRHPGRGRRPPGRGGPDGGGHRHHESARDPGGVRPLDRAAVAPRHRVAGPPHRRHLRRVGGRLAIWPWCGRPPD